MTVPSHEAMIKYLRKSIKVAQRAKSLGHHPFGSILVSPEGEILLQHGNYGPAFHAESELARVASLNFSSDYLSTCILYTSVEPCAMCAGTCYWANIGTIVYAMPEKKLGELTAASKENPILDIPCREVLSRGSRKINVIGPFPELIDEVVADHIDFWKSH